MGKSSTLSLLMVEANTWLKKLGNLLQEGKAEGHPVNLAIISLVA